MRDKLDIQDYIKFLEQKVKKQRRDIFKIVIVVLLIDAAISILVKLFF